MKLPSPREARDLILGLREPLDAAAVLAYAGLTAREILSLTSRHLHREPSLEPIRDRRLRGLREDEIATLLRASTAWEWRVRVAIGLMLCCALRSVEVRRLRWRDVERHDGRRFLRVRGKGGSNRVVPLPPHLSSLLDDPPHAFGPSEPVVPGPSGPLGRRTLIDWVDAHLGEAGVDCTAHGLRRTSITWLLRTGTSLEDALYLAGHSGLSSHELYVIVTGDWLLRSWRQYHPLGAWDALRSRVTIRAQTPPTWIYVPGTPLDRGVRQGTERWVPIPGSWRERVERLVDDQPWDTPRAVSRRYERETPTNLTHLRQAGCAYAIEAGAHPILAGMLVGVSPAQLLTRQYLHLTDTVLTRRSDALHRIAQRFAAMAAPIDTQEGVA